MHRRGHDLSKFKVNSPWNSTSSIIEKGDEKLDIKSLNMQR
jgi:hypothetical protein